MGSVQQIRVKWNHHQSNFPKVFDNLLHKSDFVDVTLSCEGHSLKAHRLVLSACSPYFHTLFLENPCKHPIVIMRDFKYSEIEAVVEYMYKGEVNISRDSLREFLRTAQSLQVKGLADDSCETNNDVTDSDDRTFHSQVQQPPDAEPATDHPLPKITKQQIDPLPPPPSIVQQRESFSQPTASKRIRLSDGKPVSSQPSTPGNSLENVPQSTTSQPATTVKSPVERRTDLGEPSIKLEVKEDEEYQYEDTQDSTVDESQEADLEDESPEPDTIILGDDPEMMEEEEPDIMFAHNNSQDSRMSQDLSSSLMSALREAGGPSTSSLSQQSPGEGAVRKSGQYGRSNKLWEYFEPVSSSVSRVLCYLCGMSVARSLYQKGHTYSSTNLVAHLKRRHPAQYAEFKHAQTAPNNCHVIPDQPLLPILKTDPYFN